MEWHHHLLSNHRNDKSKDDNDENNVVGPKKKTMECQQLFQKLSTKNMISKQNLDYFKNWHEELDAFQH